MNILEALLLGIMQGATEFLPISSSAHLVLVPWWLGWDDPPLVFDVAVHIGTTIAVIVYFFKDWLVLLRGGLQAIRERTLHDNPDARLLFYLIIATLPAAILGLLLEDFLSSALSEPRIAAIMLFVTAGLLLFSERWSRLGKDLADMRVPDALVIGFAQAAALIPGISRSGSTIAAGLIRHLNRVDATRFSFLLSTPIILGAGAKQALEILMGDVSLTGDLQQALVVGFLASLITGYLCVAFLLRYVREHPLSVFAAYCVLFGSASLLRLLV